LYYQKVADRLEPGQSAAYSVAVPVDSMDLFEAGIYAVGVDIRSETPADDTRVDLDTQRTVLPWMPDDTALATVPVSLLWPITAPPALLPDGTLLDDSLAEQLAPRGRLGTMVDAAAGAPVSWFVDPDLLDTVDAMADGYEVRGAGGSTSPGTGGTTAAAWQSAFAAAVQDDTITYLPYARPDLNAFATAAPELSLELSEQSVTWSQEVALTRGLGAVARGDVVWPAGGRVGDRVLSAVAASDAQTIVLSGAAVAPSDGHPLARVATDDGELSAVVTDAGLDQAITDTSSTSDPYTGALEVQQRWLAETFLVALDAADEEQPAAPLVGAAPQDWSPSPQVASALIGAWTSASWIAPTPLDQLATPQQPALVVPDPTADPAALPGPNVGATVMLDSTADRYTTLLADAGTAPAALDHATARSSSSGWRAEPAVGAAYSSAVTSALTSNLAQVSVTVPESVTLSSHTGVFPLTVTNDLDEAVVVRLAVDSTNVDRLQVDDVPVQRVEAGEKASVEVTAEASSNGKVPIRVQVITTDGSPLGPQLSTVVNATDYGTIGWVIVGAGGLVFGASLIRRVVKGRRASDTTDDDTTDDDTSDGPDDAADADTEHHRQPLPKGPTHPVEGVTR
ncbi:MAG TPA: DUF6049 family protein, partial [Jiangellaceae bacterium]|nr:DUF6049 family protein [Jiangellaceae bacterium]